MNDEPQSKKRSPLLISVIYILLLALILVGITIAARWDWLSDEWAGILVVILAVLGGVIIIPLTKK